MHEKRVYSTYYMGQWKWYVYIIECLDGTYYTGCTWSIPQRMEQHSSRLGSKYTMKHGFKKLVYHEVHDDLMIARQRERQIKDWSKKKKKMLIDGKWSKEW